MLDSPSDLTLGTVILVIFGIFMLLSGLFMFPALAGEITFKQDSAYGLLLVLLSLHAITLGKTPFGTFRRTWIVIITGFSTAVLGTAACFIPGFLAGIIPGLVGFLMVSGGIVLFINLLYSEGRARQWIRVPGILQHLTFACGSVYLTGIVFGLMILFPWFLPGVLVGLVSLIFSSGFFYLAWCIHKLSQMYPPEEKPPLKPPDDKHIPRIASLLLYREIFLSIPVSFILLLGIIFIECSIILIPVSQGYVLFSRDSQFGLLMVIMAIQVLALGKTPFGVHKRSWLLIGIGVLVSVLGIYSCIVPGLLSGWMLTILGLWNLLTGGTGIVKRIIPAMQSYRSSPNKQAFLPAETKKLYKLLIILHLLTMGFGMNLLLPGLIPGVVILVNLFILGVLMVCLAFMLEKITMAGQGDRIL